MFLINFLVSFWASFWTSFCVRTLNRYLILSALVFLGLQTRPGWSTNFHEHYTSLTGYDDYKYAFAKLSKNQPKIKDIDHTLLGPSGGRPGLMENCAQVFEHVYGITIAQKECDPFTLAEAAQYVLKSKKRNSKNPDNKEPDNIETIKRGFFEFNAANLHSPMSMEMIGWNVRTNTQKLLTELSAKDGHSGIYHLFDHYLKNRPLEDRKVVTLSIGASAYKGEKNRKVLKELKNLFKSHNTKPEFFLVWQRNKMIADSKSGNTKEFDSIINQLEGGPGDFNSALKDGLIDGLDLVGSLHEDHERQTQFKVSEDNPSAKEVERIRSGVTAQLKQLFRFFEKHPTLQLKLHAWEKPDAHAKDRQGDPEHESHFDGEFYKALRSTLSERESNALRVIRIGHIGGIDPDKDIPYFKELATRTHTQFIFEANIQSSIGNHEAKMEDLVKTVDGLIKAGFDVVLGTDGAGILAQSDAHYEATLKTLEAQGLSKTSVERIKHSSQEQLQKTVSKTLTSFDDLIQALRAKLDNQACLVDKPQPCLATPVYNSEMTYLGCHVTYGNITKEYDSDQTPENSCLILCRSEK